MPRDIGSDIGFNYWPGRRTAPEVLSRPRQCWYSAAVISSSHQKFIERNTRVLAVPHAPELRLHLADEAVALWQRTEEELNELGLPPPFWAFAWAGGQALARYVLDHPATVTGKTVLDFAAGSGLVGIAAKRAGASEVEAVDIDAFATEATRLNAALNGVSLNVTLGDIVGEDRGWNVILAGDICYEKDTAARVMPWLSALATRGTTVLVGDPGRAYLPVHALEKLGTYEVPVSRALEDAEIKRSSVFRLVGGGY